MYRNRLLHTAAALAMAVCVGLGLAGPAAAEPATTVAYPAGASATRYAGLAFDTCTAPSLAAMQAWSASPYRGVGVYVGGVNRTCAQPELTQTWVGAVSGLGWRLLPIYKGRQARCGGKPTDLKIMPSAAGSQGKSAADDAAASVQALGMIKGSAIYYNMEHYTTTDTACRTSVLQFLAAWTKELHRLGYVSGVYANLNLGARDLAGVYSSRLYARPDALWIARYDGNPALTGWAGISGSTWATHQRAKQYRADFSATYGGLAITIDADNVDAPVATVAYPYRLTGTGPVNTRSGPGRSYPVVTVRPAGSSISVACQAPGSTVGTTKVWDKLSDGSYVSDPYVSTPSSTGFSAPVARCQYPYQVSAASAVNQRTGPGAAYSPNGQLASGSLAWVTCQRAGSKVGTTRIWDKITDRQWVSDNYVATPSSTGYSPPAPRC